MVLAKRWLVLIGLLLSFALLVALILESVRTPGTISGAQRLVQAEFSLHGDKGSWQPITLPDNWHQRLPGYDGFGWYAFHVLLPQAPKELWGIYIPQLSMNAELYINGSLTSGGGSMQGAVSRHWNLPLYFQIAPSMLHAGGNEIKIRLRGFSDGNAGLAPVFIGLDKSLFPVYRGRLLHSHELSVGAFSVNLALGLILLVWWRASRDIAFFWFASGSLLSCVYILDSFWVNATFSHYDWRWITHATVAWSMCFYYLFMLRMLERRVGWPERILLIYTGFGAILLRLADHVQQLSFALSLHIGGLAMVLHLIALSCISWLRDGNRLHLWLGVYMAFVAAFGFADWVPMAFHLERNTPFVYYLGPVAFSLAVSLVLLTRFLNALDAERNFARNLRVSLEKQEKKLQEQHRQIADLEREHAVNDERIRIVRELHDGLGGHLMSALSLSEQQQNPISANIHNALDEFRIIMDSLDAGTNVLTMLGMLRQRIEPSLEDAGIALKWNVKCKPEGMGEGPEASLHVMRIVQESVANAIRHGKSKQIALRMDESGFDIADDGCGFPADDVKRGRGLNNMEWRAKQLGARMDIQSIPPGVRVKVEFMPG